MGHFLGSYLNLFFTKDGNVPGFVYSDFSKQLSSFTNKILIIFNKLNIVNTPSKEAELFETSLNWLYSNINSVFTNEKTPKVIKNHVHPLSESYTLLSHSSAGHIVTYYLNRTCGLIDKLVLLDPVDGSDPFGIDKSYIIHPPNKLSTFKTPTLVAISGLSQTPVFSLFPACAPEKLSNLRFYDAFTGPTWFMNITNYGHADILDNWVLF